MEFRRKIQRLLCAAALCAGFGAQADLVSYWPLENNANDAYGANNGAVNGSVGFNGTNATFTGSGMIAVPYTPDLNTNSFTVSLWANSGNGIGHRSPITSRRGNTPGQQTGYILYEEPGNTWQFWTGTPGSWPSQTT